MRRRFAAAVMVTLVVGTAGVTLAQALPRLHVLAIGQHADRLTVAPHEQFHVTIRVVVGERLDRLDELVLGELENCTIVGDERLHAPLSAGTEFTERLTLEAEAPGSAVITPAHLDAIDASSGRRLRYSASQAIRVRVTSGSAPIDATFRAFVGVMRTLLLVAGVLAAALIVLVVFVLRAKRTAAPPAADVAVPELPVNRRPSRATQLAGAVHAYRTSRSADALSHLRGLLFESAGVNRGATLADALRSLGESGAALRFALAAAERAAFGPAGERERAGDELLTAVEAYSGRAAAKPPA